MSVIGGREALLRESGYAAATAQQWLNTVNEKGPTDDHEVAATAAMISIANSLREIAMLTRLQYLETLERNK